MMVLILIIIFIFFLYLKHKRNYNYWLEKGVKHDKPLPLVGNCLELFLRRKNYAQILSEKYWKYPEEKIVGFYRSGQKELVIRDPEIIKKVLTTDSSYFNGRAITSRKSQNEDIEPLMKSAFFSDGDFSKQLRQLISPTFTTAKLKAMFPLVYAQAKRLQTLLAASTTAGPQIVNAKDVIVRYNVDFISSVGFGLDVDTLNDEHGAFKKLSDKVFSHSLFTFAITMLQDLFPNLCGKLKFFYEAEKDFIKLITNELNKRNYEPSGRNDFIDIMLTCKKNGATISLNENNGASKIEELDDNLIAAQAFLFFAAGFETSSTAMSITLHQLAYHPEIQNKVQKHIDAMLEKYNKDLCYEAVQEMTYLKCAFLEGMRIFPVGGKIGRVCTKRYTFPELNVTIDPGVRVSIPLMAIHNDPQYFDSPEEYRPERFDPEQSGKISKKFVYLPFGAGPRNCIGLRLGEMQSLTGLAAVLSRFSVEPAPESVRVAQVDPKGLITQVPKGGLPLIFKRRNV